MEIIADPRQLAGRLNPQQQIALVPTMGNLHAGHLALVRQARTLADQVVVSIFVNPLQFGAGEDFDHYPRTLEADCARLAEAGADIVFAPTVAAVYPVAQSVFVEPSPIAAELCGAFRPGHFRGVATVVLKLFNLVQPQIALFGKKDFQQLFIIREMVQQLNLPIRIVAGETVRDTDGLALSSRNGYLTPAERQEAVRLYQQLTLIRAAILQGETAYDHLAMQAAAALTDAGWQVDYITVRDAGTLLAAGVDRRHLVVLGAARLGRTRLIDNIDFELSVDAERLQQA